MLNSVLLESDLTLTQVVWGNIFNSTQLRIMYYTKMLVDSIRHFYHWLRINFDSLFTQQHHLNIDDRAGGSGVGEALWMFCDTERIASSTEVEIF